MAARRFILFITILYLAAAVICSKIKTENMTAEKAKAMMHDNFIGILHKQAGEIQLQNIYNMIRMYTLSSQEQAQQVVEYVEQHSNLTKAENLSLRMANNGSASISDCIIKGELSLLQAYRITWYNVQDCIRSTQLTYEKKYVELNRDLDAFKASVQKLNHDYTLMLNNCADQECLIQILVRSIVKFEETKSQLEEKIHEGNNLNSRYIVRGIAMGCVAESFNQIHSNYNIGKNMSVNCFNSAAHQRI